MSTKLPAWLALLGAAVFAAGWFFPFVSLGGLPDTPGTDLSLAQHLLSFATWIYLLALVGIVVGATVLSFRKQGRTGLAAGMLLGAGVLYLHLFLTEALPVWAIASTGVRPGLGGILWLGGSLLVLASAIMAMRRRRPERPHVVPPLARIAALAGGLFLVLGRVVPSNRFLEQPAQSDIDVARLWENIQRAPDARWWITDTWGFATMIFLAGVAVVAAARRTSLRTGILTGFLLAIGAAEVAVWLQRFVRATLTIQRLPSSLEIGVWFWLAAGVCLLAAAMLRGRGGSAERGGTRTRAP